MSGTHKIILVDLFDSRLAKVPKFGIGRSILDRVKRDHGEISGGIRNIAAVRYQIITPDWSIQSSTVSVGILATVDRSTAAPTYCGIGTEIPPLSGAEMASLSVSTSAFRPRRYSST